MVKYWWQTEADKKKEGQALDIIFQDSKSAECRI
jgi:hypothetical protein